VKKYKWMIPIVWHKELGKLRFVNYRINKDGIVKRIKTARGISGTRKIIKSRVDKSGYVKINLSLGEKRFVIFLHRLLWETFVGRIPKGHEMNHNNPEGDKTKNGLSYLECVNRKKNMEHAKENGLNWTQKHREEMKIRMIGKNNPNYKKFGENNPGAKLSNFQAKEIRNLYFNKGFSQSKLGDMFNVSKFCVYGIVNEKTYCSSKI